MEAMLTSILGWATFISWIASLVLLLLYIIQSGR
jgi:hypothetical protein